MVANGIEQGSYLSHVIRIQKPCCEHFVVTLEVSDFPTANPGQFLQILCHAPPTYERSHHLASDVIEPDSLAPVDGVKRGGLMLRRPFSIAGLSRRGRTCHIDILGRVVGAGTAWISALKAGDAVGILGPLGNGFTFPPKGHRALLLAGGVGLPPIQWWGAFLQHRGIESYAIYGVQCRDLLPISLSQSPSVNGDLTLCVEAFSRYGIASIVTTDDGSCGLRGNVTDGMTCFFRQYHDASDMTVYACGPVPMLKEIASICRQRNIPCQVAIERVMGCGMGTCQSCVVQVRDPAREHGWRYALCCTDGPVFDAEDIVWSSH